MSNTKLILICLFLYIMIASCDSPQKNPLNVKLSSPTSVETVISQPIEMSVPNEISVTTVMPEPIEVSVQDEIAVKTVISEPVEITVPDNILVATKMSGRMEVSLQDKFVVKTEIQEPIEVSVPEGITVRTVISEPIEVSLSITEPNHIIPEPLEKTTIASNVIHDVMLKEAHRLYENDDSEKALEIVIGVLKESDDQEIIDKAKNVLKKIQPGKLRTTLLTIYRGLKKVLYWTLVGIIIISLFLICIPHFYNFLVIIFTWSRNLLKKKWKNRWRIDCVRDSTKSGINELVISSLQYINSQRKSQAYTAGLIRLETPIFNSFVTLNIEKELDILPATEALPTIAGIDLKAIASLSLIVLKWVKISQPAISGRSFMQKEDVLVIRLTSQDSRDIIKVVSVTGNLKDRTNMASILAEEASYKMLYMILHDSSEVESERAYSLRRGIKCLAEYTSCYKIEKLEEANEIFSSIQEPNSLYYEAQFFKAIVLDILEKHDEAIELFKFVVKNCNDKTLSKKARYNQAIACFRKYNLQALDEAMQLLDDCVEVQVLFIESAFEALALAAKANVIAHKIIFWKNNFEQSLESGNEDVKSLKESLFVQVFGYMNEINKTVTVIEKVDFDKADWTDLDKRQVKWAAKNALGNMYLNISKYFIESTNLDKDGFTQKDKKKYLNDALSNFHECEKLLSPGVETLTNLGTTLIELGRTEQAREYLNRAIELPSHYEYAYYRSAQSWEKDGNTQEVLRVIKSFQSLQVEPRIPGFIRLIEKYKDMP